MDRTLLTAADLDAARSQLQPDWTVSADALTRLIEFDSFPTAVSFIVALAPIAEGLHHHPDLKLSWRTVELTLSTHSAGGVTGYDLELARQLDPVIAGLTG